MDTKQIEVSSTQEVEIIEDTKNNKFKNKKIYIIGAICTVALVGAVLTTALIPQTPRSWSEAPPYLYYLADNLHPEPG